MLVTQLLFQSDIPRNNIVVNGDYRTNNDYSINEEAGNGDKYILMVILAMIIMVIFINEVVILRVV